VAVTGRVRNEKGKDHKEALMTAGSPSEHEEIVSRLFKGFFLEIAIHLNEGIVGVVHQELKVFEESIFVAAC
jgi:hypothetical protein